MYTEKQTSQVSMPLTAVMPDTTNITLSGILADQVTVSYDTMSGNQPNTYGNFLAIWQSGDTIPWNTEPLNIYPIPGNTPNGSVNFTGLDLTNNSYIVGYAVGIALSDTQQKYGNICSTAYIPASSNQTSSDQPNISIGVVGSTSVSFNFQLPEGILPQSNGAWAGIWRSGVPSYNNPPEAVTPISINAASGGGSFNNFNVGRGLTYTIGLFMSGYSSTGQSTQTALACSLTFTN